MAAERLIRAFPVQFLSPVGIDMIHHQVDIFLHQFVKVLSFRHHPADHAKLQTITETHIQT